MSGDFQTAGDLLERRASTRSLAALAAGGGTLEDHPEDALGAVPTLVAPDLTLAQAKALWNHYFQLRDTILADPACVDDIEGTRQMNRTGATRLALAFGLSIRQVSLAESRVQVGEADWDYRYIVSVEVSKGGRKVEGIGSCRVSEVQAKTDSQREHFALARAWTRATKRAIADILGGTDAD